MTLLRRLNSRRSIAGEILVIVIGVLIALFAEEVVQRLNWQEQVKEARKALDEQLLESKYAALERLAANRCVVTRLEELDQIVAGGRSVSKTVSSGFSLAPVRLWASSSWDAATASGAVARMTPEVRHRYANLFSMNAVLNDMNLDEFQTFAELRTIERHSELTETSRDRLAQNVARLRSYNELLTLAATQWLEVAQPLELQLSQADAEALQKPIPCPSLTID